MKNIYEYTSYRLYLSDYYLFHKENDPGFSYRKMAQSMGFSSPNYFKLIIDGKRNIGDESLLKIVDSLGFKKKETEYFTCIVNFDQAKNNQKKNYYFNLIKTFKPFSPVTKIASEQFELFNNWYTLVIRELISGEKYPVDFEQIGAKIVPPVSGSKVKHSIDLLLRSGMITIDEASRCVQTSPVLNTENEVHSLAVKNYHIALIDLARDAVVNVESSKREISAVTAKISQKGFDLLKEKLQNFRQELLKVIQNDADVDRVYQINLQMFPVSKEELNNE